MLAAFLHLKFKNWQTCSRVIEIITMVASGVVMVGIDRKSPKGAFWSYRNVLYLDWHGGYLGVYIYYPCILQIGH